MVRRGKRGRYISIYITAEEKELLEKLRDSELGESIGMVVKRLLREKLREISRELERKASV